MQTITDFAIAILILFLVVVFFIAAFWVGTVIVPILVLIIFMTALVSIIREELDD